MKKRIVGILVILVSAAMIFVGCSNSLGAITDPEQHITDGNSANEILGGDEDASTETQTSESGDGQDDNESDNDESGDNGEGAGGGTGDGEDGDLNNEDIVYDEDGKPTKPDNWSESKWEQWLAKNKWWLIWLFPGLYK